METLQLLLLFLVFISLSLLMFFRKIPALLALPLMAFFLPIISGVSVGQTIEWVMGMGSTRLAEAYTIAIFGSMISIMLQKTGVAEKFIKTGAELSGDKAWNISVFMLVLVMLLFTTLGGLGAIIMVSTVVLPILAASGVAPVTVVGIFLLGLSIGGILNVGNWAVYTNVLHLEVTEVRSFALVMFLITFLAALVYVTIELYRGGHDINVKKITVYSIIGFALLAVLFYIYPLIPKIYVDTVLFYLSVLYAFFKLLVAALIILVMVYFLIRILLKKATDHISGFAYLIPIIPLLLILMFEMNFIAAFIVGLLYGFLTTYRKNSLNILIRSILEGGSVVMPAVALMLGIGMLLNAVMGPNLNYSEFYPEGWPVLLLLKPVIANIVPESALTYIFIFSLAAPLALYRGPLNVWGMGYGIAAVLLASGLAPGAIMGLLLSVGQIQGISDPTNTQNVWLANEMRIDVQKILWNTLPYTWAIAIIGLIIASLFYF
ncbi:MAG: citrate transporter [Ignavibacteriaceae bacterium]|nr:citrate transporter [Ignavibacteriaceae bacterium]